MKIVVASDLHGSALYGKGVIDVFHREEGEKLLLLGDLLYHGPRNPLPDGHNVPSLISLLNNMKEKIMCVRGNCDAEVDQMVLAFPITADFLTFQWQGRTVFATHGHIYNRKKKPRLKKGDMLLMGHTHVPCFDNDGENYFLNPGSVTLPKEHSYRGYILFTDDEIIWKTLEGDAVRQVTVDDLTF